MDIEITSKQASKQVSKDSGCRKECQDNVCRKHEKSSTRICRKCLSDKRNLSNIKGKGLQRANSDSGVKRQIGIDLCFVESRIMDVASCIAARYDAGICKHKLEHTGVLVEIE